VQDVAENSNSLLPMLYRYTAVWGSHEGSLLLWALVLSLWTAAVARFSQALPASGVARVRGVRPWTNVAWAFLTFGIALGSWWAYYELGWGGWWFWDPVENASFMPWLVGTALIHSLAVTEKRGLFKGSTLLLAIGA